MIAAAVLSRGKSWIAGCVQAWDGFWFTPRTPHLLAVLRILTGVMLLYSHLVLATDLMSFLGQNAWINNDTARQLHDGAFGFSDWARSYLWYIDNSLLIWIHHGLTIVVTLCFAVGFMTRITAPAAWFLQLMYLHRLTGTLFGLDQIVTYCAMYLMLAPSGSWLSVDAWLRCRLSKQLESSRLLQWLLPDARPSVAANVATRLLQIHLCVIYLFGGLAKARGTSWWDGTAMWYSVGNYEYQSMDMTWLARFPIISSAISHLTLFWEISYIALIWPKLTRPVVLTMALLVHGGIAMSMGMITFGLMMISANLIFVEPSWFSRSKPSELDDELDSGELDVESSDWNDDEEEWEEDLALDPEALEKSSLDLASSSGFGSAIGMGSAIGSASDGASSDDIEREEKLKRYELKLKKAADKIQKRSTKLKDREAKYSDRVRRLKEREAKISKLVERRREAKAAKREKGESDES